LGSQSRSTRSLSYVTRPSRPHEPLRYRRRPRGFIVTAAPGQSGAMNADRRMRLWGLVVERPGWAGHGRARLRRGCSHQSPNSARSRCTDCIRARPYAESLLGTGWCASHHRGFRWIGPDNRVPSFVRSHVTGAVCQWRGTDAERVQV
jgi:hypothetical protein